MPQPLYRWLTKNMCRVYIFLELKEFLPKSPTSLLAWLWVERQWSIAQPMSRVILGRGQCRGNACCLTWGRVGIGKETVIQWISHLSDSSRAVQLSAAALLAVDYRVIIQPTMLKQKSSKFILRTCLMLSRNEEFLCKNVILFIQLPNSHASAVYLSSPFSCCE